MPAGAIHQVVALSFAEFEPVFGKLGQCQVDNHFTLRVRPRVDGQLKLYYLAHNIEKLANNGCANQEAKGNRSPIETTPRASKAGSGYQPMITSPDTPSAAGL